MSKSTYFLINLLKLIFFFYMHVLITPKTNMNYYYVNKLLAILSLFFLQLKLKVTQTQITNEQAMQDDTM